MTERLTAPLAGTVTAIMFAAGETVRAGQAVMFVESMKLEHPAKAAIDGTVAGINVAVGDQVKAGQQLATLEAASEPVAAIEVETAPEARAEWLENEARHELLLDAARAVAVDKRHGRGRRTAREMLTRLIDDGSWMEYGGLAVAAQRDIRSDDELRAKTPADGFIGGLGRINGLPIAVASYDYMVLAGTQGMIGHRKKDRLFDVIDRLKVPVVLFAEGGGGRPSDTDVPVVSGLDADAFRLWAKLSGKVPRIGIGAGNCFAGNAGLLGMCDVVIATEGSSIGMGGPAMITGGGLGDVAAADVGPAEMHAVQGSIDLLVIDEDAAVDVAGRLVDLIANRTGKASTDVPDQTPLRDVVPADRRAVYDIHDVIDLLMDPGSEIELRKSFGTAIVTTLARLDGRTVGVIANDCQHGAGALDSDACDKAARFLQLCDSFGLPVISLVDTPGIMVGPEAERTGIVRHSARLFTVGAQLTVPLLAVVVRRAYGLGAQAMLGGSVLAPLLTVAWPTGELGPMGLEGAVRLALRTQLEAMPKPEAEQLVADSLAMLQERARAVSVAAYGEIDDVIDPASTRQMLIDMLRAAPESQPSGRWIDNW